MAFRFWMTGTLASAEPAQSSSAVTTSRSACATRSRWAWSCQLLGFNWSTATLRGECASNATPRSLAITRARNWSIQNGVRHAAVVELDGAGHARSDAGADAPGRIEDREIPARTAVRRQLERHVRGVAVSVGQVVGDVQDAAPVRTLGQGHVGHRRCRRKRGRRPQTGDRQDHGRRRAARSPFPALAHAAPIANELMESTPDAARPSPADPPHKPDDNIPKRQFRPLPDRRYG